MRHLFSELTNEINLNYIYICVYFATTLYENNTTHKT